jgi:excisionase family DNA binding protein
MYYFLVSPAEQISGDTRSITMRHEELPAGASGELPAAIYQSSLSASALPDILSRRQVAALLQIGLSTLDTRIPASDLPRIKIGKSVRFFRSDVEKYLLRRRVEGTNG